MDPVNLVIAVATVVGVAIPVIVAVGQRIRSSDRKRSMNCILERRTPN